MRTPHGTFRINPPVRRPHLQLPQSSEEASILSRGNARAERIDTSGVIPEPSPTDPSRSTSMVTEPSHTDPSRSSSVQDSDTFRASPGAESSTSQLQRANDYPPAGTGDPNSNTSLETSLTMPETTSLQKDWEDWLTRNWEED